MIDFIIDVFGEIADFFLDIWISNRNRRKKK